MPERILRARCGGGRTIPAIATLLFSVSPALTIENARVRHLDTLLDFVGFVTANCVQHSDRRSAEGNRCSEGAPGLSSLNPRCHSQFWQFVSTSITDQTTLQIIDVEDHEAKYCLDILDSLFDHHYVKPADANAQESRARCQAQVGGEAAVKIKIHDSRPQRVHRKCSGSRSCSVHALQLKHDRIIHSSRVPIHQAVA